MTYRYKWDALVAFLMMGFALGLIAGLALADRSLARLAVAAAMLCLGMAAGIWLGHKAGVGG